MAFIPEYKIIYSSRRTKALTVDRSGKLIVRVPYGTSDAAVNKFVLDNSSWIEKTVKKASEKREALGGKRYSEEELKALYEKAARIIPGRVEYYSSVIGVNYGRITIRLQKSRWGSCSSAGNLNFNCLLADMPEGVLDSVVVHELCHRLEMNHSPRFYELVHKAYPEYDKWNSWLKENGPAYLYAAI